MACVVSLALDGEPTHLRRLIRRLKGRMPGVPILLGLWLAPGGGPDGAARETQTLRRRRTGRSGSLREAVEAVLAAAQETANPGGQGSGRSRNGAGHRDGDAAARRRPRHEPRGLDGRGRTPVSSRVGRMTGRPASGTRKMSR